MLNLKPLNKLLLTLNGRQLVMQVEYDVLIKNQTWSLVPLPPHKHVIGCKWVFRIKENLDDTVNRFKARLVAKGFHQRHGFDFNETFSPVVKSIAIRLFLLLPSLITGQFNNLM